MEYKELRGVGMGIGIEGVRIKRVGSGRYCLLTVFPLFDTGRQGVIFSIQSYDHAFGCSVSVDRRYLFRIRIYKSGMDLVSSKV
jgi:hypothetical protein